MNNIPDSRCAYKNGYKAAEEADVESAFCCYFHICSCMPVSGILVRYQCTDMLFCYYTFEGKCFFILF